MSKSDQGTRAGPPCRWAWLGLALAGVFGCESGVVMPDAFDDAADAGVADVRLADTAAADVSQDIGEDTSVGGCTDVCFEWDGWPSGAPYRVERSRCNFAGANAGQCPSPLVCGESLELQFDALTRSEPVCEAPASTEPLILRAEVGAPVPRLDAPIDVVLVFRLAGSWPGADGDVRVVDAAGVERYAGPVPESGRLPIRVDRGVHIVTARFIGTADVPTWFRTGALRVAQAGVVEVPLSAGRLLARGLDSPTALRLQSEVVGPLSLNLLESDDVREIALVPGEYEARVQARVESGLVDSDVLARFRIEHARDVALEFDAALARVEGRATQDGESFEGEVVFVDTLTGRIGGRGRARAGRYEARVFPGEYVVRMGPADSRGQADEVRIEGDEEALDLEVSTVPLVARVTLDGASPPAAAGRLGYLQLSDAFGSGVPGVNVEASTGDARGRVPSGRFDVVFHATDASMPAPGALLGEELAAADVHEFDVRTALLSLAFVGDATGESSAALRISHPERRILSARIPVEDGEPFVVAEGRWHVGLEHARLGVLDLGEHDVRGEMRIDVPLHARRVVLTLDGAEPNPNPGGNRGVVRFDAHESSALSPAPVQAVVPGTGAARVAVDLLPGVYTVSRTCIGALGCLDGEPSERLFGWLRIE